jgi:hypothetical protein
LAEYAAQPHWATVDLDARAGVPEGIVQVAPVLADPPVSTEPVVGTR